MAVDEWAMDKAAFEKWTRLHANSNSDEICNLKEALSVAMRDCITEKQRLYLTHYYFDNMNITRIAAMYNRNKSTVSRTLKAARKNLYRYLRFTSISLLRGKK